MGSTYTYTQSQLTAMTTALANANSDYNAGDYADANAALLQYYQAQVTGDPSSNRGYAQAAIDVINNVGSGAVANLNVQNAVGASAYTDQFKSNISLSLATQDLSQITGNNDLMPTLAQVADEHATVFGELGIPIENWGGTAFEAVGDNYINAAGYTANPAELSQIQSTNFTNLPVSTITDAYNNLYGAGFSALGQLNLPADVMGALNMSGLGVKIDAQYGTDLVPLTPPPGGLTPLGFLDTGNGTYQLAETNASTGTTSTVSYSATGVPLSTTTTSGTPLPASFDGLSILSVSANPADAELLLQTPNGGASSFLLPASDLLNIQTGMPNGVLTTNGNQDSLLIDLDNATIDASGSGNYILALGTGAMVNAGTGSNTILLAANSDSASASNAAIIVAAGISNVTLTGNNDIDTTGTSSFVLSGNDDTDNATGGTITTIAGDTGEVITGSGFSLNASAGEFNGTVTGSNNSFSLDANSGSTLSLSGTGNTAVTVGNTIQLVGASSSATISGADTVDLEAANQKLILDTTGDTIDTIANDTGETITGSSLTLDGSGLLSGVVTGANDTFNLSANSGSTLGLSGTGDVANSIGNMIQLDGASSSATISGADTVDLEAANQKLILDTAGDTIDTIANDTGETITGSSLTLDGSGLFTGVVTGANNFFNLATSSGSNITLSGTDGGADDVHASGDAVTLASNTQLDITGTGDLNVQENGDSLGISEGGNTIDAGAGESVYITNTDGVADTVNASGDAVGGTTANGQATGITMASDVQVNVVGGDNTISMTTGDTLGAYGGGNMINAGAGEEVYLSDTGGTYDLVTASNDATGIDLAASADANVSGSNDTINMTTGDSLGSYGGGNTINAGAGENVYLSGTGSAVDAVNASNDAAGITLAANVDANVGGSDNTINLNTGDALAAYGGGDTINAGAGEEVSLLYTGGTFDLVNASNDATGIDLAIGAEANVSGDNNTINMVAGDALGAYGGGNTINAGAGESVYLGSTGSVADQVIASNDAAGITLAVGVDANVVGNDDTISMATDDIVGVYGLENTIDAGAGDGMYLSDTGSTSDLVNVSNDAAGIDLAASAQANVVGSDNTISMATGDTLGAYGGGDTINAGAGNEVYLGSTSGTFDSVNASNDATGIDLAASANANVVGGDDTIRMATGDTLGAYGGGDTINAGAGNEVYLGSTGGTFDSVNASNDATGIDLGAGANANVSGSDDVINVTAGDVLGAYGNDNAINAVAGDNATIDGNGNTLDVSGTAGGGGYNVTGQDDIVDATDQGIELSSDDSLTVDGSRDLIGGGSGDTFTVNGTDDDINATDSSIIFDGSDAGDTLSGEGNTWSDPDDDDGGYYGYGLTSWQGRGATAAQMAAAQKKSGASGSVYENASWADKTVTWSFASASGSNAITNAAEQAAVEQAFKAWAAASGLTFEEASAGTASDIEVGFGDLNTATSNTIGLTHYTYAGGELQAGVQVQLESPGQAPLTTDASGQLMYASTGASFEQVALHEIGHALGLADNDVTGSVMNMVLGTSNSTLDATDIANIQELYSGSMAGTSSSGSGIAAQSTAQLHQLLQAMASFDAGSGVADTVAPSLQDLAQTGYLSIGPSQAHLAHAV
jgi:predicted Zn-dependent protease